MRSEKKSAEWFDGFNRGYRSGTESLLSTIKDFSDGLDEKADQAAVEALEDRCFCDDCASEPVREYRAQTAGPYSSDAMRESIKSAFRREFESGVTGFVVCVNDEPYVDTFRVDPSLAWEAFLPILEADPGLANEEIRLVKMVEE